MIPEWFSAIGGVEKYFYEKVTFQYEIIQTLIYRLLKTTCIFISQY
jgi:hypothetical protein